MDYWDVRREIKRLLRYVTEVVKSQPPNLFQICYEVGLARAHMLALPISRAKQIEAVHQGTIRFDATAHVEIGARATGCSHGSMWAIRFS
jgi:hypothetical protein